MFLLNGFTIFFIKHLAESNSWYNTVGPSLPTESKSLCLTDRWITFLMFSVCDYTIYCVIQIWTDLICLSGS